MDLLSNMSIRMEIAISRITLSETKSVQMAELSRSKYITLHKSYMHDKINVEDLETAALLKYGQPAKGSRFAGRMRSLMNR